MEQKRTLITSTQAFKACLSFWCDELGHGGKSKIADATGIDRSYFTKIVSGTQPGPEAAREAIAKYLGYRSSDDMVAMGRKILAGEKLSAGELDDIAGRRFAIKEGLPVPPASPAPSASADKHPTIPAEDKPWKYSEELANNRHGKVHSRQRAFYIWENLACRDEELPGSFDSSVLQWQIEDYINGQYTDEELYNAAVQWCQECKKVTLEYYRNLLKQEEEERRRKKGGLAGK